MTQSKVISDPATSEKESFTDNMRSFLGCLLGLFLRIAIPVAAVMAVTYIRVGMRRGTINDTIGMLLLLGLVALGIGFFLLTFRILRRRREAAYTGLREMVVAEHGEGSEEVRAVDAFAGKLDKSEMPPKSNTERAGNRALIWLFIGGSIAIAFVRLIPVILEALDIGGLLSSVIIIGAFILTIVGIMVGIKLATASVFKLVSAQYSKIEAALEKQNYAEAVRLAEEMVNSAPGFDTYSFAALTYLRIGRWGQAEATAQKAIDILEGMVQATNDKAQRKALGSAQALLGVALMCQQRYTEAELILLEATKNDPTNQLTLINYAEVLLHQRKSLDVAMAHIEKTERIDAEEKSPPKSTPLMDRAWLYAQQGNREAAYQKIKEAHQIAATKNIPALTAEVTYGEGLMYEALGDMDKAYSAFAKARSLDREGGIGRLAEAKMNKG